MTDLPRLDVPVAGGTLATFRLGSDSPSAPVVLAVHGITASSRAWLAVARATGGQVALQAVDLRGRSASRELPPPFGIAAHVADLIAVLDSLELERTVVIGHSLGAYIAAGLAQAHPDRVSRLVLVDGGLTIPGSQDADPEEFMNAFLAATLARMNMTFADREAYRAWWWQHPALSGQDVDPDDLAAYADHDLVGEPPRLRSSVNPEAVRCDGIDVSTTAGAGAVGVPAALLCAERGMTDDPHPMQPLELVQAWADADPDRRRAIAVPGVNHYTITLGARGAAAVAAELQQAAAEA